MTVEEYRQRMIDAFHNADCDNLIALVALPTEKEFEHLEWLLKNHYHNQKQQPCEDWYDVPSDEMTLEQARQAVKDLRKKLAEYLEQQPYEDCISREAVHSLMAMLLSDYLHDEDREKIELIDAEIADLPSVTPKQQPCEDAISRRATVERLCKVADFMNEKRSGSGSPYIMAALFIQDNKDEFPPVTPKEKTAHWINKTLIYKGETEGERDCYAGTCSACGTVQECWHYCSGCGARMVGDTDG